MQKKLTQEFVIPCYETDRERRLRPASFMDMAQEIGGSHATILGAGYEKLLESREVWIISREHLHFYKYPLWRDRVILTTWHKGTDGPFFLRDFILKGEDGTTLVAASSSWLLMNIDTRRLSRDFSVLDYDTAVPEDSMEHACDKAQIPRGIEAVKVAERIVSYSDEDMNGHTNNARYLVWAMDVLDHDRIVTNPPCDVWITFNNETHLGETIDFYLAEDDGYVYVEGRVGEKSAFCVKFGWQ